MNPELLTQKSRIETWLAQRPRCLSTLSFVNLFLWKDHFRFEFEERDGNLCVFATDPVGTFLYFPPLGKSYNGVATEYCFAAMRERNRGRGVSRIENVSAEETTHFSPEQFSIFHKSYEYLYHRKTLIAMQGEDYKSKRHDYNLFEKLTAGEYQPFEPRMTKECLALYDRWAMDRKSRHPDPVYEQMLQDNRGVHQLGMEYFEELGMVGRVVLVEEKVAAYTFGYALTDEIFCVLFEIADINTRGLPVYIFMEFCREAAAKFKFINVMDDFGTKNLEQTKLSFRPQILVPAYAVSERK